MVMPLLSLLPATPSPGQDTRVTLETVSHRIQDADLIVIHTANTAGKLASCGCSKRDLWGLPQQAALIRTIRESERPLVVLDSGDLSDRPDEWDVVARALDAMRYDALTYGALDIKAAAAGPLQLPASLLLLADPERSPVTARAESMLTEMVERGGIGIGVVGAPPPAPGQEGEAVAAAAAAGRQLRDEGADIVVALSSWGAASDLRLAKAAGSDIDLILGGADWAAARGLLDIAGVSIAPTAQGGKAVSLLTAKGVASGQPQWEYLRVPTSVAREADPAVDRIVSDHHVGDATRQAATAAARGPVPDAYVRVDECRSCHAGAYAKWSAQPHAQAIGTLQKAGRVLSECLACHSEEYRRMGDRPGTGSDDAHAGVECASCHGDGLLHAMDPAASPVPTPAEDRVCLSCHTSERSPDFDFPAYLARIKH